MFIFYVNPIRLLNTLCCVLDIYLFFYLIYFGRFQIYSDNIYIHKMQESIRIYENFLGFHLKSNKLGDFFRTNWENLDKQSTNSDPRQSQKYIGIPLTCFQFTLHRYILSDFQRYSSDNVKWSFYTSLALELSNYNIHFLPDVSAPVCYYFLICHIN